MARKLLMVWLHDSDAGESLDFGDECTAEQADALSVDEPSGTSYADTDGVFFEDTTASCAGYTDAADAVDKQNVLREEKTPTSDEPLLQ